MDESPYGPTAYIRPRVPIVLEEGEGDWGAYVPSIPVCAALGKTREEVLHNIEVALSEHLQELHDDAIKEEIAELQTEGAAEDK